MSPCCLSCSDGSVAVTGHLLCCTFLSWRLSLSRPPTGLCHVAPTFVQDSLHVTKKPTGWPLFNHCLCRTDQEGTSIGRENGKWLSFTPGFPCSGWSRLHLCLVHFKCGMFKCSTLNGSWQGQGLVSQAPNLPTAELLWLGPPALCTAAASTTAVHDSLVPCLPRTTWPPAAESGSTRCSSPRATFMEARWASLSFYSNTF